MNTLSTPMIAHNQNGMTFTLYTDGTYVWDGVNIPKIKYPIFIDIVSQAENVEEVLECIKNYQRKRKTSAMIYTTYKLEVKMSIDTIYLLAALGEMYARVNPNNTENTVPLTQVIMRAGLESMRQSGESNIISFEIYRHEMIAILNCLFTTATLETFFTAFRNKEFIYYNDKTDVTCDDLQNGINILQFFIKDIYSQLPVEALH